MIITYFMQYSKYNENIFIKYINEFQYSVGRLSLMIPFAVTGFTLASLDTINNFKKFKFKTIIFSIIIFILVDNFSVFYVFSKFADYNGIKLNVLSLCIIICFFLLPFEKIKNKYIKAFIEYITRYTAGIFYLHIPVYRYSKQYIYNIKKGNLKGLFINYILSYTICHLGTLIFGKTKAVNLFS